MNKEETWSEIEQQLQKCIKKGKNPSKNNAVYCELRNLIFKCRYLAESSFREAHVRKSFLEIALKNCDISVARLQLHALKKLPIDEEELNEIKQKIKNKELEKKTHSAVYTKIAWSVKVYLFILVLYFPCQLVWLHAGIQGAKITFFISLFLVVLVLGMYSFFERHIFYVNLTKLLAIWMLLAAIINIIGMLTPKIMKLTEGGENWKERSEVEVTKQKKKFSIKQKEMQESLQSVLVEKQLPKKKPLEKVELWGNGRFERSKIEMKEMEEYKLELINLRKLWAKKGHKEIFYVSNKDKDLLKKINRDKNAVVDLKKIVTGQKCAQCHKKSNEILKKTPHFSTFGKMFRKRRAKEIFKKLHLPGSIKGSGRCSKCHYTEILKRNKRKAISGVSCESCHGAGKDWIQIHNNKSVPLAKRRKKSLTLGMGNPNNIYSIAQHCYECHSIADEELINKGAHHLPSKFELVSWSQGMVRHNFIRGHSVRNPKSNIKRLRIMFIIGQILDLEYSLRGLAKATSQGAYYKIMRQKVGKAYRTLIVLNEKTHGIKELVEILGLFKKLNFNKKQHLLAGADLLTLKAKKFEKYNDGSTLSVIDQYLPKSFK